MATAQGPTFATEEDIVDIVLLKGATVLHLLHQRDWHVAHKKLQVVPMVSFEFLVRTDGQHGEWRNTEALTLTANGTGNNAFPSFSSDGSEVRQSST